MRKIKNTAMRGECLNVPDIGLVRGDDRGMFIVPEAFALRLIGTPGWHAADSEPDSEVAAKARAEQEALEQQAKAEAETAFAQKEAERLAQIEADKRKAGEVTVAKADEKEAERLAAEGRALEVQNAKPTEPEAEEGPDLDSMDRAALLETAAQYGVTVDTRWGEKRLRQVLDKALYDDEAEVDDDGSEAGGTP